MGKGTIIQDPFLNAIHREKITVHIFLTNGIKLQGTINSFDQFVILLDGDSKNPNQQMVYKHAISTVMPATNPKLKIDE